MTFSVRLWLTRFLVAVIAMGGGLNGYLALAPHGDHGSVAHVLGLESGTHDHEHTHTSSGWTYVPFCHVGDACHEEPGSTTGHVHVSCCATAAMTASEVTVAHRPQSVVIDLDLGPQAPPGQVFYPLFKPPRASA